MLLNALKIHQGELTQAELIPGRVDLGAKFSGRVDLLPMSKGVARGGGGGGVKRVIFEDK